MKKILILLLFIIFLTESLELRILAADTDLITIEAENYTNYSEALKVNSTLRIYVDNVQKCENNLILGPDYNVYNNNIIGNLILDQGEHTIKVYCSNGGFVLTQFTLKKVVNESDFQAVACANYNDSYLTSLTPSRTKLSFPQIGAWATYLVTVEEAGEYIVEANTAATVGGYVSFNKTDAWTEYSNVISVSGKYKLTAYAATKFNNQEIAFLVNDIERASCRLIQTETSSTLWQMNEVGFINLQAGDSIKVKSKTTSINVDKIIFERVGDIEQAGIITNSTDYTESTAEFLNNSLEFSEADNAMYAINVPISGHYKFYATASTVDNQELTVYNNSIRKMSSYLAKTIDNQTFTENEIGAFNLNAGTNMILLKNHVVGNGKFQLKSFRLNRLGDVTTVNLSETITTQAIDYTNGSKVSISTGNELEAGIGSFVEYSMNVQYSGYYKMTIISDSSDDASIHIVSNGLPLESVCLKNQVNICFVYLESGLNILKLFVSNGGILLESFALEYLQDAAVNTFEDFTNKINKAETKEQIENIFNEYKITMGTDIEAITSTLFYNAPILMSLIDRNFNSAKEVMTTLLEEVKKENESPSVELLINGNRKTKLESGNVTIQVDTKKLRSDCTAISVIFKNNQIYKLGLQDYSNQSLLTFYFGDVEIDGLSNYVFKVIYIDNFENLNSNGLYTNIFSNIYVSTDGNDLNTGDVNSPFKTIGRAKQKIAEINNNMTGDIIVNIMSGYYQIDETEVFGVAHSGKNGYNVILKGYDSNNLPVISGGVKVTGWSLWQNGIYRAPLTEVSEVRNLYINDMPAIRARTTKYAYQFRELYGTTGINTAKTGFPESFSKPDELEMVVADDWRCHRIPVKNITYGSDTNVLYPDLYGYESKLLQNHIKPGMLFHLENALELLDEQGEFYYNGSEGYIYYYPYENEDLSTADTFVGNTEILFSIKGEGVDNKASHIILDNLSFKYGAWNAVSANGMIDVQADAVYDMATNTWILKSPAQFEIEKATNIVVKNCVFSCLGSSAISMIDGVSNTLVEGNLIKDVSGTGIIIGTWLHDINRSNMEKCRNIEVRNNVIRRVSAEFRGGTAISVYFENGINIINNDIRDVPYTAISMGWGWRSTIPQVCGYNKIKNNYIENVLTLLNDGAHIYTNGVLTDSEISENFLKKSNNFTYGGIYFDAGSSFVQAFNNVVTESERWFVGSLLHNVHDVKLYDNYSDTNKISVSAETSRINYEPPILPIEGQWSSVALGIMESAGVKATYSALLDKALKPTWRPDRNDTVPLSVYNPKPANMGWIEVEDFMPGGEGVGYHKIYNPSFNNNPYRRDDEVNLIYKNCVDSYVVHANGSGEWMNYIFTATETKSYNFDILAYQQWSNTTGVNVYLDGIKVLDKALIPKSSNGNYITQNLGSFNINQGTHVIKVELVESSYIDAFRIY